MLKRILLALPLVAALFSASNSMAEDYSFWSPGAPYFYWEGLDYHSAPCPTGLCDAPYDGGICIGGQICGTTSSFNVNYNPAGGQSMVYLNAIEVFAHDNVGDKTRARLVLYVNGIKWGSKDVKKDGSLLTYQISGNVGQIKLVSVHEDGYVGGEETVIMSYKSY